MYLSFAIIFINCTWIANCLDKLYRSYDSAVLYPTTDQASFPGFLWGLVFWDPGLFLLIFLKAAVVDLICTLVSFEMFVWLWGLVAYQCWDRPSFCIKALVDNNLIDIKLDSVLNVRFKKYDHALCLIGIFLKDGGLVIRVQFNILLNGPNTECIWNLTILYYLINKSKNK